MVDPLVSPAKPRRLWRVVLVVSLAFNLAVIGLVAGAGLSGRWKDGPPRGFDLSLGPVAAALEHEQRREIRDRFRASSDLRPITPREARADTERLLNVLRADVFDVDALQELLTKQQGRVRDMQVAAQVALVAQIAEMTHSERTAFADRLAEEMRRHRPRR